MILFPVNETVAERLGNDRQSLDDFVEFMLGMNRMSFHEACTVSRDQSLLFHEQCWRVYCQWQEWQRDAAGMEGS